MPENVLQQAILNWLYKYPTRRWIAVNVITDLGDEVPKMSRVE